MTDDRDSIAGQVRRFLGRQRDPNEDDTRDVRKRKRKLSPSSQALVTAAYERAKAVGRDADDTGAQTIHADMSTTALAQRVREIEKERHRAELHAVLAERDAYAETAEHLEAEVAHLRALLNATMPERQRLLAAENMRLREERRKALGR